MNADTQRSVEAGIPAISLKRLTAAPRIFRLTDVCGLTGLSRSSIYAYMAKGLFPAQIKLGPRAVGWAEHDVAEWLHGKTGSRA